jgi:hypothetical protein
MPRVKKSHKRHVFPHNSDTVDQIRFYYYSGSIAATLSLINGFTSMEGWNTGLTHEVARVKKELLEVKGEIKTKTEQLIGKEDQLRLLGKMEHVTSLAYIVGACEGLREGWNLHRYDAQIQRQLLDRYLVPHYRKYPDATDEDVCRYLDNEVQRAHQNKKPLPMPKSEWGQLTEKELDLGAWRSILKKRRHTVSQFLHDKRDKALGPKSSLLEQWEKLGSRVNAKDVQDMAPK